MPIYPSSNNMSLTDTLLVSQKRQRELRVHLLTVQESSPQVLHPTTTNCAAYGVGRCQVTLLAGQSRSAHNYRPWPPPENCPLPFLYATTVLPHHPQAICLSRQDFLLLLPLISVLALKRNTDISIHHACHFTSCNRKL